MADPPRYDVPPLPVDGGAPAPSGGEAQRPMPLPVPARTSDAQRGLRAVAWGGLAVLVLTVGACAVVTFAGIGSFLSGMDDPETGVMRMAWGGDGRYAVIEYVSPGEGGTTSVVAWDSLTGGVRSADGFRLVTVEPSSTQVWVTTAPGTDVGLEDEWSPWTDPVTTGLPVSDGPGDAYSWDLASGDDPVRSDRPAWRAWKGPTGWTASLTVDPAFGLYPRALSFSADGTGSVMAPRPLAADTFVPLGWSPSGRYFAVQLLTADGTGPCVIYEAESGRRVAPASMKDPAPFTYTGDDIVTEESEAMWDSREDRLWIMSGSWNAEDEFVPAISYLTPGSDPREIDAPSAWKGDFQSPMLLGSDAEGVLVGLDTGGSTRLWRLSGGRATAIGIVDSGESGYAGTISVQGPYCYSPRGGLLVAAWPEPLGGAFFDGSQMAARAAVCDLEGDHVRVIWPPPPK